MRVETRKRRADAERRSRDRELLWRRIAKWSVAPAADEKTRKGIDKAFMDAVDSAWWRGYHNGQRDILAARREALGIEK